MNLLKTYEKKYKKIEKIARSFGECTMIDLFTSNKTTCIFMLWATDNRLTPNDPIAISKAIDRIKDPTFKAILYKGLSNITMNNANKC